MIDGERAARPEASAVPGVQFRSFRGPEDFPAMLRVLLASESADQNPRADTLESLTRNYSHLTNCNPATDMILAEHEGELVGYARGWWWEEPPEGVVGGIAGFVVPAWRRKGIGRALLGWSEARLRSALTEVRPVFQLEATHYQPGLAALAGAQGYHPARFFFHMLRPSLDEVPDWPLPAGLELRPATPDHYPAIWASMDEASREEWGYQPPTQAAYDEWKAQPRFQPHLWQIAWDVESQQVAGHVLTFIDAEENALRGRLRGYTEGVGVGRRWRRRGLARALIGHSLRAQRAAGMTESALVADVDSQSGVTGLYESCGFRVGRRDTVYRKAT